ncbi:MAG: hypothetical protein JJU36_09845 [Phycisphaeraceae bacterium]|nr:hypothetical protein [Phycisphaeraceae bacterium]
MATQLKISGKLGGIESVDGPEHFAGSAWWRLGEVGDGLVLAWPDRIDGSIEAIVSDMLLAGDELAVFELALFGDAQAATEPFKFIFSLLGRCQAQVAIPTAALDQHRWSWPRQGAMLKPMCFGAAMELGAVRVARFTLIRKGPKPVEVCIGPWRLERHAPEPLTDPLLPDGPLVDRLGQSRHRQWAGKVASVNELVAHALETEVQANEGSWPEGWSRWGGWMEKRFEATGFFRVERDAESHRWWLVDPDGCAFFSCGINCVRPDANGPVDGLESVFEWLPPRPSLSTGEGGAIEGGGDELAWDHPGHEPSPFDDAWRESRDGSSILSFTAVNAIRAFGSVDDPGRGTESKWYRRWMAMTLGTIRRVGFNTIANWSDVEAASKARFPYVMPLRGELDGVPKVFRDFADVFDPGFEQAAADYARQLESCRNDPAMIGYFLMNEPKWGFASQCPALGMLLTTEASPARDRLAEFLLERYGSEAGLAEAWGKGMTLDRVRRGIRHEPLGPTAHRDLEAFSTIMIDRFFRVLSDACRQADPNHLNLGIRYYTVPPDWALAGMKCFDVFSMNAYTDKIPAEGMERIHRQTGWPLMVGEWHFGALDVGLPGSGIGHVRDQHQRGLAYRVYLEDAAAKPWCVGVHYFTWSDQACWGRFDGENYNIGFSDVCFQLYRPLAEQARTSHERLYTVASGRDQAFEAQVEYLPRLF